MTPEQIESLIEDLHELSEHEEVYNCKECHQLSAGSKCFFCAYRRKVKES